MSSSLDEFPSPLGKKRPRSGEDGHGLSPSSPPLKQALLSSCSPPSSPPRLSFLEELCEIEPSLDPSVFDPPAGQEDLVTEMMRSLEKVIGDGDGDTTAAQLYACDDPPSSSSPSPSRIEALQEEPAESPDLSGSGHSSEPSGSGRLMPLPGRSEAESQIRLLLEASDDELGLPPSTPNPAADDDWSALDDDDRAPDPSAPAYNILSGVGWLDGEFDATGAAAFYERDYSEIVLLDAYM